MASDHLVQLFDSDNSLAMALSSFIQEGLAAGETVLILTTRQRWDAISTQLADEGVSADRHVHSKRLTFEDAVTLMQRFIGPRGPVAALFDTSVGRVVRTLAAQASPLRIYGDMVDLLAGEGDYAGAEKLETLWNELAKVASFTLFCGYSAAHFGHPRHAESLRQICRCHSHVRSSPDDMLGSFLLDASGATARA